MTAPDTHDAIVDREAILARVDGDEALLGELIALFQESSSGYLENLGEAIGQGNALGVRVSAHALKGAIANFSEGGAFQNSRRLEEMGRSEDLAGADEVFRRLEEQVQHLHQALAEWAGGRW
jgi:HPt (histidine-containing phosphotransfer) domain-containing protein